MKIVDSNIYRYSLPLTGSLPLRERTIERRDGILVRLIAESGACGWGEAAPLPGFSKESLDEVSAQLPAVAPRLHDTAIPEGIELLDGGFEHLLGEFPLAASARFALEMAIINLLAAERSVIPARLLTANPRETIRINGLLINRAEKVTEETRAFQRQGYRAIKLKVGRNDMKEDLDTVGNVIHELDTRTHLRLDANRTWTEQQALIFARSLRDFNIEYIEEPLQDASALPRFIQKLHTEGINLPIAIDETLLDIEPAGLEEFAGCTAMIVKPTLLGGVERAAAFARAARKPGLRTIITSSFESSLTLAFLTQLTAAFGSPNIAAGLGTADWLEKDLLTDPLKTTGGRIMIGQAARAAATVNLSLLTEIPDRQEHHG